MKTASRCACLLLLLCSVGAQAERVYRWVDAQGKVHYSDRPQGNAQAIEIRPGSGAGLAAGVPASGVNAAECQRLSDRLASYRAAQRLVEKNALGQEREYTPEERARLLQLTEQSVQRACGAAAP